MEDRPHPNKTTKQYKPKRGKFYGKLDEFVYVDKMNPEPPEMIEGWKDMDLYELLDFIEDKYKLGIRAGDGMEMTLGLVGIEMRDFGVAGTREDWFTGFPIYYESHKIDRYLNSMRNVEGSLIGEAINLAFDYINNDYPAKEWNTKYYRHGPSLTFDSEFGKWRGERWEHLEKDDC